jgi:predicted nucleotidyltransferase
MDHARPSSPPRRPIRYPRCVGATTFAGSAADGSFDPERSDLDFLVDFGNLDGAAYADAYFGLREGLEAPFRRPVDLLTQPALENPHLRTRVEAQRQRPFPPA